MSEPTVIHPVWCDPTRCTAPAEQPTHEQYKELRGDCGEHRSALIESNGLDFVAYLIESIAPWKCTAFLRIEGKTEECRFYGSSFPADVSSPLLLLMRHQAAAEAKRWPTLVPPLVPIDPVATAPDRNRRGQHTEPTDVSQSNAREDRQDEGEGA